MTKEAVLHDFMNSFGMNAYKSSSVPDDVTFPYAVYDGRTGYYDGDSESIAVQFYFYTDSEMIPNAFVETVSQRLGFGGVKLKCDTGYIWIYRGKPWCLSLNDDTDKTIKVRNINLQIKFMTV